jgi:hypothetical protein
MPGHPIPNILLARDLFNRLLQNDISSRLRLLHLIRAVQIGDVLGMKTLSQVPGPVRLELGDMGAKNLETRRSLEGIDNMVRGNSAQANSYSPRSRLRAEPRRLL